MPFALFALVVVSALVLGLTGAQALVAQGSFRIEELRTATERLERSFAELRLEAARRASPERIARWASGAGLVLRDPDAVRIVVVEAQEGRRGSAPVAVTSPALAVGSEGG